MTIANRIKRRLLELCRQKGTNLIRLGEESGVSRSTIDKLLMGETQRLNASTVRKLCDGLKISMAEFYDSEIFRV